MQTAHRQGIKNKYWGKIGWLQFLSYQQLNPAKVQAPGSANQTAQPSNCLQAGTVLQKPLQMVISRNRACEAEIASAALHAAIYAAIGSAWTCSNKATLQHSTSKGKALKSGRGVLPTHKLHLLHLTWQHLHGPRKQTHIPKLVRERLLRRKILDFQVCYLLTSSSVNYV